MASRIIRITSWTSLSLGGAIVNGLVPPAKRGLGIFILPGENLNVPTLICLMMSSTTSLDIPSRVVELIPTPPGGARGGRVIFPPQEGGLPLFSLSYAISYKAGS
uniref:Uncharacterized protein n=1 Tax=Morchella importuna TaxID=1174673 RepID=A0A650AFT0_9PEZI|nr:hypothetical protein [Morchella importuna]QGN66761.1 hypothetical protein [Morchella importuna]